MISGDPWAFDPQRYGAATAADTLVKGMKLDWPGFESTLTSGKNQAITCMEGKREPCCNIHNIAE